MQPFERKITTIINAFNECVILVTFLACLIFKDKPLEESTGFKLSLALLGLMGAATILSVCVMVYFTSKLVILQFRIIKTFLLSIKTRGPGVSLINLWG